VFELGAHSVSITGPPGGIIGNISIAANGKLSLTGSEYITGTIFLGPGATFSDSSSGGVGGVVHNVDLSAQIAAAYAANANAANMPCTQTFTTLDGKSVTTITGTHGVNVICVKDISLSGKQILLTGPSDAKFIFNITGKLVLTGGGLGPQIRVDSSAGLAPSAVLYNLIGTGQDVAFSGGGGGVSCCAAIVDGTILAPYRKIALSPGLVNGEVISGLDISIVSGSSVKCPPCQ
jgi:choice-of-anchor A domain-containing protein